MDDGRSDDEAYTAYLEKLLLDNKIPLPKDPYTGLRGKDLEKHKKITRKLRGW